MSDFYKNYNRNIFAGEECAITNPDLGRARLANSENKWDYYQRTRIWTPRISQALTHCCQEGKDCTRISGLVVARATVPDGNRWWRSYRFNALQVPRSYRISSTTV